MAWSTSPDMPLPPIPMTTTFSMSSRFGKPVIPLEPANASATCSGNAAASSHIPSVSRTSCSAGGN